MFVDILNKYLFFMEKLYGEVHSIIDAKEANELIELIKEHVSTIKSEGKFQEAKNSIEYFNKTLDAIKFKQALNASLNQIVV